MSNSQMVDAVNSLVGTLLAGVGEVSLPDVGSLYAERRPAQRVSKKAVVPPCRVVSFSSQQRGVSLVDRIAEAGKVELTQAEEIYQIWLSRARKEETLTIEGVGVLKFKNFSLAPEFDAQLNPLGHTPVKIKSARGLDWTVWLGIAAIVFVAVVGGYQYWTMNYAGKAQVRQPAQVAERQPIAADAANAVDAPVATDSAQLAAVPAELTDLQEQTTEEVTAEAAPNPVPVVAENQEPLKLESGRRYVVFGVFSTLENARGAAAEALQAQIPCRIYVFGNKFMVSPFESDAAGACAEFIRAQGSRFPDLWTHAAR